VLYKIYRVYIKEDTFYSNLDPIPSRKRQKWPPNVDTFAPATCWCSLTCPEFGSINGSPLPPSSPPRHSPSPSRQQQAEHLSATSSRAPLLLAPTSSMAVGPGELPAPRALNHGAMSLRSPIHGAQLLGPTELLPPMALSSPTAPLPLLPQVRPWWLPVLHAVHWRKKMTP
jgi:hypothetical protein